MLALRLSDAQAGNLVGSSYGGWGFNSYWDTSGSILSINGSPMPPAIYIPTTHKDPALAESIADSDLWSNPFFLPFLDPRLTTSTGGEAATDMRTQLLAEPSRLEPLRRGRMDFLTSLLSFHRTASLT